MQISAWRRHGKAQAAGRAGTYCRSRERDETTQDEAAAEHLFVDKLIYFLSSRGIYLGLPERGLIRACTRVVLG
jgi:hypothetical protein